MPSPTFTTTNADWTEAGYVTPEEDSLSRLVGHVYASDHGGNVARWEIDGTYKRVNSGAPQLVGALADALVLAHKTLGAATWDVRLTVDGNNVKIEVKGQLSTTIDWLVTADDPLYAMVGAL